MARSIEPQDMLAETEEWLPKELAPLYHVLYQEVASLNLSWNFYLELYGKGRSRIELLNYSASTFFAHLEPVLLEATLLSIVRLTDPPKSGGRNNLTLRRLPGKLQRHGHSQLAKAVDETIGGLVEAVEPIRKYRNEWLSHRDLKTRLGKRDTGWGFSRADIKGVVKQINAIPNIVERELRNGCTLFEEIIHSGGVDFLIFALEQAREMEQKEQKMAFREP